MQNITKTRVELAQVGIACLQIAHACERLQTEPIALSDLGELADALREVSECARKMQSSEIDPKKDHDGDTQPSNDPPAQPVCKCGHSHRDHMPRSYVHPVELWKVATVAEPGGCCIYCDCERFEQ